MGALEKFKGKFKDGVLNLFNSLTNTRNALNQNIIYSPKMQYFEMRELFKNGVGNKIISIKTDYALNDSIEFDNESDKKFYEINLSRMVSQALQFALAYGRGIIVIVEINKSLDQPLSPNFLDESWKLEVFSGDLVTSYDASMDLLNPRFYKPRFYSVRGYQFHHTRVIDFNYVMPPQIEMPLYQYGGISEFQLIKEQLTTDGIVQRAGASILEKNSTIFYKIQDFKDLLMTNREADIIKFFGILEQNRSIYGAGMIDNEDDVTTVNQSLTDIDKVDNVSLRRLAMVTNIPITWLVGENAQGMNSTGDNEMDMFWWMIKNIRQKYALLPINELMVLLGKSPIKFKEKNDLTPEKLIEFEKKAFENAKLLFDMGEDPIVYLESKNITVKSNVYDMFKTDGA